MSKGLPYIIRHTPCIYISWWRHQMETFPALLANSPVTGEFHKKRSVTRSFGVSLICTWIHARVNNREAGDLRRHRAYYDAVVMVLLYFVVVMQQFLAQPCLFLDILHGWITNIGWSHDCPNDSEITHKGCWNRLITSHNKAQQSAKPLRWRHNEHDGVSDYQPHYCLFNRLFRRRSKKTSKLRVTGLGEGNSPVTGEFPAQMIAENVSIWWRHHVCSKFLRYTLRVCVKNLV